jgi:uncharacterized cofD-like protein
VEPLVEQLLQYRFHTDSDLNNHAMGNLLLTALFNITGNLTTSLESLSKILNLKGRVLPFTEEEAILVAHTKDGDVIEGESSITKAGRCIDYIEYKNKVRATDQVVKAIKNADLIIFGIGSLYTSVIPNLLDERVRSVLLKSKAKKMYVCNIMTEHGETDGFHVSDCVREINSYIADNFIDVVVANNGKISDDILDLYKVELSEPITIDRDKLNKMGVSIIEDNYVSINNKQVRHDYIKTALAIFTYIACGDV